MLRTATGSACSQHAVALDSFGTSNSIRKFPHLFASFFLQLEMILQAQEYEGQQDIKLDEFFSSTEGKWRTELGRKWAAEIVSRRKAQ